MRRIGHILTVLMLIVAVASPLMAQKKRKSQLPAALRKALEKVELTNEQQAKIDDVKAEYLPKLAEARLDRSVTRERAAAVKKAREEGKKGKDLQAAGNAVLSAEQKEQFAKYQQLNRDLRAAVIGVLTDEQIASAGLKKPRRKKSQ